MRAKFHVSFDFSFPIDEDLDEADIQDAVESLLRYDLFSDIDDLEMGEVEFISAKGDAI
jgi:hypothetical protein